LSYADYQAATAPTMFQGPYGQAFQRALGLVKDYLYLRAKLSVTARFPDFAPADALGAIGDERKIDQGVDAQLSSPETSKAYAQRLINAWLTWLLGGTAWGMLQAFAAQGYFPQIVCANGLVYSVDSGLNLTVTQGPALGFQIPFWNTFFIWFGTLPSSWTDVATPPTPSSSPSLYEVQRLRRIILNRWKPAWALCIGIAVQTSGLGGILGAPGITLGEAGLTLGGGTVAWFGPNNYLTIGLPPARPLGSPYTLGEQV
jgi:hypothetical protein